MTVDVSDVSSEFNYKVTDETDISIEGSQIRSMFAGSTVFLTGGTGFLGKLLVEKLLRSCPEIKKMYLLARPKKNKTTKERLQEQFEDVVYERLRKEHPDFIQKITVIEGDVSLLNLGISDTDRDKLFQEVEFIFHGAATVKFDESLKVATDINVRGTREMLNLAQSCKKLRAYVHISTAYSNCVEKYIDEKLYEIPVTGESLIYLAENMDEKTLVNMTPALVGNYPNTYAFTKSIAEQIVKNYSKGLPIAIYRPSIVISTAMEPVPGWTDNVYGPIGVTVGAGLGVIHVLQCNPESIADLVPADMVGNACIAIAWKTARDYTRMHDENETPMVYNYVSSVQNPLSWNAFKIYSEKYGLKYPFKDAVWYYSFFLVQSKFLFTFLFFVLQWIPTYIADGIAVAIGRKPILKRAMTKISKFTMVIAYFALGEWKFTNNNTQMLFEQMSKVDKKLFNFDINSLDWDSYFKSYILGIKKYLLKESPETMEEGLKRNKKLRMLHYVTLIILFLVICWFMMITWRIFYKIFF